jgi:predicted ATPase
MAGWLTGGARVQAVILLVEDLHWADPSTLDLIRVLAEQSAAVPLLLLVTARPEFKAPWPHRSHHAVIALAPLEPRDVLLMVEEVAARHALSAIIKEALVARTGGVPLFIEEVTRLLLEGDGQGGTQTIPLTLQASLTARLDRLGAAKEVAQIAAVLGREFPYPLVRAIAGLEDGALTAALDRLAEADVIQAQGMPPEASYRFKHALVQDAAYESLLKTRRRELHRAAAQALAERFKEIAEAQPELLAHHLTEAGDTEAAIKAWRHAGETALRRPAYVEAMGHYGKAIALAETLPDGPETRRLRLRLQIAYGQVLIPARGHGALETTAAFARAAELAASIEDTTERFSALYGLWVGSYVRGESGPMRQFSAAFLHDAERAPGSPEIMVGRRIVGCTEWYHGAYAAGAEHLTQALAAYDPERHLALAARYGQDSGVACRCYSALALWPLGDIAQALRLAADSIEHARTTGYLPDLPYALTHVCYLDSLSRDTDRLALHAEELVALSLEHGLPIFLAYGVSFVGCVRWRKGEREDGRAEMARGTRMLEDGGMTLNLPLMRSLAAEAEAERGETGAALALIDDALAVAERTGQHWQDAELHRGRGDVLLNAAAPDVAGAEASFRRALEIARGQQTRTFELRAALSLARLYHATKRDAEARTLLTPIVASFAVGTELPELAAATQLLAG